MEKELYDKLMGSLPERYRKDVKDEIEFNHFDLEPITEDIFLTACKWVLDNKKLHLRRVAPNASCEFLDSKSLEIKELEEYINKFNEIAV